MHASIVVVAVVVFAAVAHAEAVVVVSDDAAFRTAVVEALVDIEVRIAGDAPPKSIAEISRASRAIVERERAGAMVWLMFEGASATLIVYDLVIDRVLVRTLPYAAPLGGVQAAEAARVTRTMLHALRVTDPPAVRKPTPPPPILVEPPRVATQRSPGHLAVDLDGGVRVRGPGVTAAPSGTLGVIWRPDRAGLAIAARLAPAATLTGEFVGRISDHSLALVVRWPLSVTERIDVVNSGGLAVHRIALDGMLATETIRDRRYDPAMRLGVVASYLLNPSIGLGIGVSADWLLRRQTYEVGTDEVVTVPIVQLVAGIVLSARIL